MDNSRRGTIKLVARWGKGGLLLDDVGPFRNFGDIWTTTKRVGRPKEAEQKGAMGHGNSPAAEAIERARFGCKEDGAGPVTRPSTDCSPSGPAGIDCLGEMRSGGCADDLDSEKGG
jgi:hypothetical protein